MTTPQFLALVAGLIFIVVAGVIMWGWPMFLLIAGIITIIGVGITIA